MGMFTGSQWGALGAAFIGGFLMVYFGRHKRLVTRANDAWYGARREEEPAPQESDH